MDCKHNPWEVQLNENTRRYKKKLNGLLNKLTNSNFDNISKQFLNTIKDECVSWDYFNTLICLIFEKSVSELQFSDLYSNLIVIIVKEFPNLSYKGIMNELNTTWNFRYLFLFMIQTAFAEETELEYKNVDQLHKLMKLISKFYASDLLASDVMLQCIEILIARSGQTEKDIKIVCDILSTVGEKLELHDVHSKMQNIFERLECFIVVYSDKPRITSLVQNCIDLRRNKWKLRVSENIFPQPWWPIYLKDGKYYRSKK